MTTDPTRNAAREFRLRIKRWKAEQKSPADTLSFDDSDKRWLAYLRAHVGNLELLPAIVTHWERTAKPITRPLKVEELCKAFVLYRQSKGLDKATLSEDRYISKRLQKHLGGYMAHELGIAEIRSFLARRSILPAYHGVTAKLEYFPSHYPHQSFSRLFCWTVGMIGNRRSPGAKAMKPRRNPAAGG